MAEACTSSNTAAKARWVTRETFGRKKRQAFRDEFRQAGGDGAGPRANGSHSTVDARARRHSTNLDAQLSLARLATALGYSPYHCHRRFTEAVGETPRAHIERLRFRYVGPYDEIPEPTS